MEIKKFIKDHKTEIIIGGVIGVAATIHGAKPVMTILLTPPSVQCSITWKFSMDGQIG